MDTTCSQSRAILARIHCASVVHNPFQLTWNIARGKKKKQISKSYYHNDHNISALYSCCTFVVVILVVGFAVLLISLSLQYALNGWG